MKRADTQDKGLTLVELAVAVLVLSLGTIAAVRTMDHSGTSLTGQHTRFLAQIAARNQIERLRAGTEGRGGTSAHTATVGGVDFNVTTDRESTAGGLRKLTVRAAHPDGGAVLTAFQGPNR